MAGVERGMPASDAGVTPKCVVVTAKCDVDDDSSRARLVHRARYGTRRRPTGRDGSGSARQPAAFNRA